MLTTCITHFICYAEKKQSSSLIE